MVEKTKADTSELQDALKYTSGVRIGSEEWNRDGEVALVGDVDRSIVYKKIARAGYAVSQRMRDDKILVVPIETFTNDD